jgi:hypothetical protein
MPYSNLETGPYRSCLIHRFVPFSHCHEESGQEIKIDIRSSDLLFPKDNICCLEENIINRLSNNANSKKSFCSDFEDYMCISPLVIKMGSEENLVKFLMPNSKFNKTN